MSHRRDLRAEHAVLIPQVLWTDDDNNALVSLRHPELNETYWALNNAVQRADFVRNLYMWDFGG